jgi:DNA transformation protein
MNSLVTLPNIGDTLAQKLNRIGITNFEQLKTIVSKQALIKISTLENSGACLNMLYALESAIQGIRWHGLSKETKQELKEFNRLLHTN